jgi:archaeosine synthase beta-subunit
MVNQLSNIWCGRLSDADLEMELKYSTYYSNISEAQQIIHSMIPIERFDKNRSAAAETGVREELLNGQNYKRAVIYLLTNGCEWALKGAHGCTMCGHIAKQTREDYKLSTNDLLRQFDDEYDRIDFNKYPILNLYNNGSFLNDNEISPAARDRMLGIINMNPNIKMLVIETRPGYVTEENINSVAKIVTNKYVEVGIGLEIKNDHYRKICINKGFTALQYERAAQIIRKYLNLRTYVLLKPLFLTEKEAIDNAVETIEYAFHVGARTISLEACTIQDYTLMKMLYDSQLYDTPWLWSIIEVIKRSNPLGKLIIGLFKFYPSPTMVPHNCDRCNTIVMEAIIKYNRTLDARELENIDCQCKREWRNILNRRSEPFEKGLKQFYKLLIKLRNNNSMKTAEGHVIVNHKRMP